METVETGLTTLAVRGDFGVRVLVVTTRRSAIRITHQVGKARN